MRLPWQTQGQAGPTDDRPTQPVEGQAPPAENPGPGAKRGSVAGNPGNPAPGNPAPGNPGPAGKRPSVAQPPAAAAPPAAAPPAAGAGPGAKRPSVAQAAPPAAAPPAAAAPGAGKRPSVADRYAPGPKQPAAKPQPAPPQQPPAGQQTMEARVSSRGGTPTPTTGKRCGRWSLEQLRATDSEVRLQSGTNKYDSQKGMGWGTPRNTTLKIKAECLQEIPEEIARLSDLEVRLQAGTNKFDSQKGMVGFGTGRDVVRESNKVHKDAADVTPLSEEKILLCEGIVRLQSGTNKFASQKGGVGVGVGLGTNRREVTKMIDTKHPEYNHETSIDSSTVRLQAGTNKFASQKGGVGVGVGLGTNRREITKMIDTKHPEYDHERSIDHSTVRYQMGSNQYASQAGMWAAGSGFGQPRWECLQVPGLNRQVQIGQGLVPYQMGSNLYASQKGFVAFGTGRDVAREATFEGDPIPYEEQQKSQTLIRFQAGWNKGDSQKGYTSFGSPRDVKGKHLKRIWELDFPELEADYVKPI